MKENYQALPLQGSSRSLHQLALLLVWLVALIAFTIHRCELLPAPVPAAAVENSLDHATTPFSEELAGAHVRKLSQGIGRREVGTDGEIDTIRYLVEQLELIETDPKRKQHMDIAIEQGSGQHLFELIGAPMIKTYYNVTNIVVKLPCSACKSNKVVLVNTHFDSMIGAYGAADAATPVAVMIETIRLLVRDPQPIRNSLVFLFNGAEETLQDASHAFITQSSYFKNVVAVLNLEASGVAGKSILFQSRSKIMMNAYAECSHPHGNAMANDLFRTGLLMGDTDYRQFIAHGELAGGLDIAIYQKSYLYHTVGDTIENLPPGTIQHMGQNALDILRHLAYQAELSPLVNGNERASKQPNYMYFDVLGYFFVLGRMSTAIAISWALVFASLAYLAATTTLRPLVASLIAYLRMIVCGLISPLIIACAMIYFDSQMLWFSHESYVLFIYLPLVLCGMLVGHRTRERAFRNEKWARKGILLFYTLLLVLATLGGVASLFAPGTLVFSMLLQEMFSPIVGYGVAMSFMTVFFVPLFVGVVKFVVPLTGRAGSDAPADLILAILIWAFSTFYLAPLTSIIHRVTTFEINGNLHSRTDVHEIAYRANLNKRLYNRAKLVTVSFFAVSLLVLALFVPRYTHLTPLRLVLLHQYDVATAQSQFHLLKCSSSPYPAEAVEAISQLIGSPPMELDMHPEARYNALQAVHPLNEVAHSLVWNTSSIKGKFWLDENSSLNSASEYAQAYAPNVQSIQVTRSNTSEDAHQRTILIPCAMNAHNMFTVLALAANVTKSSAPFQVGKYGRIYIRQSSGGIADVDWESKDKEFQDIRNAKTGCDLSITVNDLRPVKIDLAASSKFRGSRNYILKRMGSLMPDYVDFFAIDALHVSVSV